MWTRVCAGRLCASSCRQGPSKARAGRLVSALFRLSPLLSKSPPVLGGLRARGRRIAPPADERRSITMKVDARCLVAVTYEAEVEAGATSTGAGVNARARIRALYRW